MVERDRDGGITFVCRARAEVLISHCPLCGAKLQRGGTRTRDLDHGREFGDRRVVRLEVPRQSCPNAACEMGEVAAPLPAVDPDHNHSWKWTEEILRSLRTLTVAEVTREKGVSEPLAR